nr:putative reverse transcriptase domain-containing protein [Tanacetum cinerariifolium]
MLKVSPWKGVIRLGKRGKLNPRYIGPFKVLDIVGTVSYRFELLQQLSRVHSTFRVSNLKKCLSDEPFAISLDEIHTDDKICFVEEPVEIMDREVKRLKQSHIPIIKVQWNFRRGPEFTREREDQFRKKYSHLFTKTASSTVSLVYTAYSLNEYSVFNFLPILGLFSTGINMAYPGVNLDKSTSNVLIPLDSWTSGLLVYKESLSDGYRMDDPNVTMEEYIGLEEEMLKNVGKWETAKYDTIWYDEDIQDLRFIKIEFPAIAFNHEISSEKTLSCEPTISSLNDEIDFRVSIDDSDDEDYTVIFDKNSFSYKNFSAKDLKTDSENDNENVMPSLPSPEPSVSCFDDLDFFKDFENEFLTIVYNDA